jgi:GH24 family phage-related lysozyme (muramidase)
MSSFSEQRREMIKEGEGCIRHMYLDTVGKVTVAVGQMMPTAGEAEKLSFIRRSNGTPATAAEIRADYESVAKQTSGQIAFSYKQFTQLDMPEQAIDALLDRRIDEFEAGLRRDFPGGQSRADREVFHLHQSRQDTGLAHLRRRVPAERHQPAAQ